MIGDERHFEWIFFHFRRVEVEKNDVAIQNIWKKWSKLCFFTFKSVIPLKGWLKIDASSDEIDLKNKNFYIL